MNSIKQSELVSLIKLYIKNWRLFVLSFIICVGVAGIYLVIKKPVYQISANVLIKENPKGGMSGMASMMRGLSFGDMLGVGGGAVDDELEIIKSHSTLYKTVKELGLNVSYNKIGLLKDKYLYKETPLSLNSDIINMADTFMYDTKFEVEVDKNQQFNVKAIYKRKTIGKVQSSVLPVQISTKFGNFTLDKTTFFERGKKLSMEIMFIGHSGATEALMRNVSIDVASKKSNVLNLTIKDQLKERGKDILNSIIKHYNEYGIEEKNIESSRTAEFLRKRIELMGSDLDVLERAVEKYKTDNHLTDIAAEAHIMLGKSSDFKERLIAAETQYTIISMIGEFLKAPENRFAAVPMSLGVAEKSAVEALSKYNELLLERLKLLRSTNPGNPMIELINEQVDATRQSLLITIQSISKGMAYGLNDLRGQEQIFMKRIAGLPQQEREFIEIKRQQEIKQALFVYLLQQQEENTLKLTVSNPKAQVIDNAFALNKPVEPKKILVFLAAMLFTFLLPVLFLHFKRLFASKFKTVSELQSLCSLKILNDIHSANKTILFDGNNALAEEDIRRLRSIVYQMLNNSIDHKSLLINSMQRGEGKTFIALNLALSIAKTRKRVILVDTDLRNSQLSDLLDIDNKSNGLYQVINDNYPLDKAIQSTSLDENLFVIPAGYDKENPSEILLNNRFEILCNELKKQYDFVIFDSAALSIYSDAMPIVELVDGTIFVTRAAYTDKSSISYIESVIENNKIERAICIINDVKLQK